ncbi:hypothetical protein CEXT_649281 [Caerostris extrusa]|uniref:Uncharacterized protein n=1 Tax=Caerostris extrusa TaxID=172846 RepID=A0AAV4XYM5_CAEEX|nr:hypothetical protein CEXT_649281 [Caerostris extrusa]
MRLKDSHFKLKASRSSLFFGHALGSTVPVSPSGSVTCVNGRQTRRCSSHSYKPSPFQTFFLLIFAHVRETGIHRSPLLELLILMPHKIVLQILLVADLLTILND